MTKFEALRRFLLPCLHNATDSMAPPATAKTKKRLSASLRGGGSDDVDGNNNPKNSQDNQETSSSSSSPTISAPRRSSRTMVIGTIFGHRGGRHVWFCVQPNRLSSKPALLLELSIPMAALIHEMQCGLVRIALEFNARETSLENCPLHSVPLWTLYCNGRKHGFAVRRKATPQNKDMLKTMQNITVGAGVFPCGSGFGSGSAQNEILYMRANYECVIGSADSECFHLINLEEGPSQELSVFLMRSK
ncbi:protein MIZU-KUSSEI 1 [Andrographis paniculata]|uniref:protein MIZU-KUSSEI 1 n=1 Tax=Andrographis paniculata TaxID=175694 RepID=UPI0021E74A3C|nr:protein MIZU-KUSSEI 1 [Andrographis paniculata]